MRFRPLHHTLLRLLLVLSLLFISRVPRWTRCHHPRPTPLWRSSYNAIWSFWKISLEIIFTCGRLFIVWFYFLNLNALNGCLPIHFVGPKENLALFEEFNFFKCRYLIPHPPAPEISNLDFIFEFKILLSNWFVELLISYQCNYLWFQILFLLT